MNMFGVPKYEFSNLVVYKFHKLAKCFLIDLMIASWCRPHDTFVNNDVAFDREEKEQQLAQVGSVEIEVPNEV
jgi:hypothetical protein